MPQARRFQRTFGSASKRRDLRDNEHLGLLLSFALDRNSNCVDVGASKGDVLVDIVRVAPLGRHIAYEPLPDHAAELRERFPQVDVRQAALSNHRGEESFHYVKSRPGMSGLRARRQSGGEEVETLTVQLEKLDSALPAGYAPSLIKVDVEGAEQEVIEGAMETIRAHRPIIVFEHGQGGAPFYGTTPEDLFRLLCDDAGLRIFDLDGGGPYDLSGFEDAYERGTFWNFVAHG